MNPPKIMYLTHSEPNSVGNGGNHRSYQLYHELQQIVPRAEIKVFVRPNQAGKLRQNVPPRIPPPQPTRWIRMKHHVKMLLNRVRAARENPFNLLTANNFSIAKYLSPSFIADYERAVRAAPPQLAIIDHVGFAPIIAINQRYGVRTLACPQNLESLEVPFAQQSRLGLNVTAYNWANELSLLGQCESCLCISKVETALLKGLGYSAEYYAYQPVAEVESLLSRVRDNRRVTQPDSGLFLMPGSAFHHSTREGMLWLLRQIEANTLPDGIQLSIIGAQSQTLPAVSGVNAHGWIDQDQLEHYLTVAEGVLIPQFRGFGASTKLIEFANAGLPIIASEHITFAVDPLPQVQVAAQDWDTWRRAMLTITTSPPSSVSPNVAESTESRLATRVRELLH